MKKIMAVILAIIVILGALIVPKYNKLVKLDNEVDLAYSQVQVVVKRRADLIPNLVETVKGYATHEEETFLQVTEARAGIDSAKNIDELSQANEELNTAVNRLNFVVESYPELKANQNFQDLQVQLESSENRISTERQRFNDTVKQYNEAVRSFPMNLLAGLFGFEKKSYFEISEQDQQVPNVSF
ncbi:LemA family protein [Anaerosphaera multitolerans]|uniref:LemA family protein n=1 Tax=Anaerosphaera multitolerans TaxID=2487351 RepID=A0A437S7G3_9FIRM|nr:LemA family protein [Anaerosphaera multitolerans]RVU54878.1 LemA family protein [Anaerosphaera multitolerans]